MNKLKLLFPAAFLLSACFDDNDFDVLRSSDSIDTNDIHAYVSTEVHTHIGETAAEDETHTTVQAEFYGYDSDGYTYIIELSENDQLSVGVEGETRQIDGVALPSLENKSFIEYIADFEQTPPGTLFAVNLDRSSETGLNTIALSLLEETNFTASPEANSEISMSDAVTLEWLTDDANNYRLRLRLRCFNSDSSGIVLLPFKRVQSLSSPATVTPSDYFSLPAENDFSSCELHSILQVSTTQVSTDQTNFAEATTKNSRQQSVVHTITLN